MIQTALPSIERVISGAGTLRKDVAHAISYVELIHSRNPAATSAQALRDFFLAAAAAADKAAGGAGNTTIVASNQKVITSGTKITATVTGSGTTGVTPTISAGNVTGLALS